MKKIITYGTYDLLHQGHINLLRRAKALGDHLTQMYGDYMQLPPKDQQLVHVEGVYMRE